MGQAPAAADLTSSAPPPGTELRKNLSGQGRQLLQAGLRGIDAVTVVSFGPGALGMSLEASGATSIVSRVVPGAAAANAGVQLGAVVKVVNGENVSDLDTVCDRISKSPRPVTIGFSPPPGGTQEAQF